MRKADDVTRVDQTDEYDYEDYDVPEEYPQRWTDKVPGRLPLWLGVILAIVEGTLLYFNIWAVSGWLLLLLLVGAVFAFIGLVTEEAAFAWIGAGVFAASILITLVYMGFGTKPTYDPSTKHQTGTQQPTQDSDPEPSITFDPQPSPVIEAPASPEPVTRTHWPTSAPETSEAPAPPVAPVAPPPVTTEDMPEPQEPEQEQPEQPTEPEEQTPPDGSETGPEQGQDEESNPDQDTPLDGSPFYDGTVEQPG